jgi:hypothetical protein
MVAIELYGLWWARALAAAGLVSPDRNRSGSNAHPWNWWSAVLSHLQPLVLPTLLTNAARNVRGVGAVLQIIPSSGYQCRI